MTVKDSDIAPVEVLRSFMALSKGISPQSAAMAAAALLMMLSHEQGHDPEYLVRWFGKQVITKWPFFKREFVESAFEDPRMPKHQ